MRRFLAWFGTNEGRIVSALAVAAEVGAGIWNAHLHQPVDLGSFGGGLAAILTASAALIAAPPAAQAMLIRMQIKREDKKDA